jgi:hypothetical protein
MEHYLASLSGTLTLTLALIYYIYGAGGYKAEDI